MRIRQWMRSRVWILLCLLPVTSGAEITPVYRVSADPQISQEVILHQADDSWQLSKEKDGVTIYNRPVPGSRIRELLATGDIAASPELVFTIVTDWSKFVDFMPYVETCVELERQMIDSTSFIGYTFTYLKLPLVHDRYYPLRLKCISNYQQPGIFISTWDLVRSGEYAVTLDDPRVKSYLPPYSADGVLTPVNHGYWYLQPTPDGRGTRATYYLHVDSGGTLPSFIINQANAKAIPNLFQAIRARSSSLQQLKQKNTTANAEDSRTR